MSAIERVFELMDTEPDVTERPEALRPAIVGELRFENVTFGYLPSRPVVNGIDLHIRPGEVLALVGPSGAGKSSLVQLVPRFYDPQVGRVLVDGHDLRDLSLRRLRDAIGIVSQETQLFSSTARDNIRYARPDASDAEVRAAAEAAHAHEFIAALPQGY